MNSFLKSTLIFLFGLFVVTVIGLSVYMYPRYDLSPGLKAHFFQIVILRQNKAPYTIGFVTKKSKLGENEFIAKQTKVLKDWGWNYYIFYGPSAYHKNNFSHFLQSKIHGIIHWILGGDYTLSLSHDFPRPLVSHAYTYLTIGKDLVDENFQPTPSGQFIKDYDGIISAFPNNIFLMKASQKLGLKTSIVEGSPTAYSTPYSPVIPKKIFYCGVNWDRLRSSSNYQSTFKSLVQQGIMVIYGSQKTWPDMGGLLFPPLPFDGYAVIQAIHEAGICLCLHSDIHLEIGVPTARVFEAAAAGAVIISDPHPFIQKHFGDSVLYIDPVQQHESLANQLRRHYKWIQTHPQEAQAMAKKSHQIFMNYFTIEQLLKKITKMHKKIVKERA